MFIYKITVKPIKKSYIGLDTKPEYRKNRWNQHCKSASATEPRLKIHKAMKKYGIENCEYTILARGFNTIPELALAEINLIKENDTWNNGLNGTAGGDGLGYHDLYKFTDEELSQIKHALGDHWRKFNKRRWAGTTAEERPKMMSHLFTPEIITKRVDTQKEYYNTVAGAREKHSAGLKEWQLNNPDLAKKNSISNGLLGAEKTSKKVTVEKEDGTTEQYKSISEFQRMTGQWMTTLREKSELGEFYNGYKIKEIK